MLRYCEEATKTFRIYLASSRQSGSFFFQIFVAFSEYLNFTNGLLLSNCDMEMKEYFEPFSIIRPDENTLWMTTV